MTNVHVVIGNLIPEEEYSNPFGFWVVEVFEDLDEACEFANKCREAHKQRSDDYQAAWIKYRTGTNEIRQKYYNTGNKYTIEEWEEIQKEIASKTNNIKPNKAGFCNSVDTVCTAPPDEDVEYTVHHAGLTKKRGEDAAS